MTIEFQVIDSNRPTRFKDLVTAALNTGWIITGPPFVGATGGMTLCLTKETAKESPKGKLGKTLGNLKDD